MYERNLPRRDLSDFRFLLQVAFWGALVHLVALPWTANYFLEGLRDARALLTVTTAADLGRAGLVLLALPALVGGVSGWLLGRDALQRLLAKLGMSSADLTPTAWDAAFRPGGKGAWVYVYLRGLAEPIVGRYGADSIAGVTPSPHDLYLEQQYRIVDGALMEVPTTAGVWLSEDEIEFIEFYRNTGE